MKKCLRCGSDMKDGFELKIQANAHGVTITDSEKIFGERLGSPKMAICPECGEISFYLEDVSKLKK